MKDKSLERWLITIFGISGLAVTMLAWLWPAMESERVMATLAGLTGLLIALFRYTVLKKLNKTENERVTVEVEATEKR